MTAIRDEIANALLRGTTFRVSFKTIWGILDGWNQLIDFEELLQYVKDKLQRNRIERAGRWPARYPSLQEIEAWSEDRVRLELDSIFNDELSYESRMQPDTSSIYSQSEMERVRKDRSDPASGVTEIAERLSRMEPDEAMRELVSASLIWAYNEEAEAIEAAAIESGHHKENMTRDDLVVYIVMCVYWYIN